jgi:hypothetical protein
MDSCGIPDRFRETPMPNDRCLTPEQGSEITLPKPIRIAALCVAVMLIMLSSLDSLFAQRRISIPPVSQPVPRPAVKKELLLRMRVEEGRVTADISNAPLQQVLKELADRTGIVFEVRAQENPPVSIHLQHVPPAEAIERIASGNNVMFYYGQGAEADRIIMARIFSRSSPGPQPALVYLGTGAVTKTSNTVETPEEALQVLASESSVEEKEIGIEILSKSKNSTSVKALTDCLSDPAPEIRVVAIEGLAAMGAQEALPGILKSLRDANPGVRQSAAMAVALLGNDGNLKDLRPLSSDKDAGVAAAAEIAIRRLSAAVKK